MQEQARTFVSTMWAAVSLMRSPTHRTCTQHKHIGERQSPAASSLIINKHSHGRLKQEGGKSELEARRGRGETRQEGGFARPRLPRSHTTDSPPRIRYPGRESHQP